MSDKISMINTQECPCECGGMCLLNDDLDLAEHRIRQLEIALETIRDCDWPGPASFLGSRADWMQHIAREALK